MVNAPAHKVLSPTIKVGGCHDVGNRVELRLVAGKSTERSEGAGRVTDLVQFRKDLVHYLPRLRRFALTLTRNADDADDLVQTACERAILKRDQWQEGSRLDSWLYTMMRNLWISEIRKRKVRMGEGQIDAEESGQLVETVGPSDQTYGNQLMAIVKSLPEGLSSVLLLVSIEGHTYQEAADILDIPIGTVMSRMSKARQVMKARLADASGTVTT
jgi:RNA polymerase sigma-70 factor, ECF subfamily